MAGRAGGLAGWVAAAQVERLAAVAGGWRLGGVGWAEEVRAVLLAADVPDLWQAAGGRVVVNPALGRAVAARGGPVTLEPAGALLGVRGRPALEKSGRFRARMVLRALDTLDSGAGAAIYEA